MNIYKFNFLPHSHEVSYSSSKNIWDDKTHFLLQQQTLNFPVYKVFTEGFVHITFIVWSIEHFVHKNMETYIFYGRLKYLIYAVIKRVIQNSKTNVMEMCNALFQYLPLLRALQSSLPELCITSLTCDHLRAYRTVCSLAYWNPDNASSHYSSKVILQSTLGLF